MKRILYLSLIFIASQTISLEAVASKSEPVKNTEITIENAERAKILNDRLAEIEKMDKSALTRVERKELRSEVKMIKEELQQLSGGVYLSIGAIIVILLLLILLL